MRPFFKNTVFILFLFLCAFLLVSCAASGKADLGSDPSLDDIINNRMKISLKGSVFFDGTELAYDKDSDTFFWSVDAAALAEGRIPEVKAEGFDAPAVCFSGSLFDEEEISESRRGSFVIYDKKHCFIGDLVVTTLPLVKLEFRGEIDMEYARAKIRVWDSGASKAAETDCLIRLRGATALSYPKKGFRISLKKEDAERKKKRSFLGMRKDDDWILYAAYNDQEKIRNVFCSNLWTESCGYKNSKGVRNGSEYRFVELFLNDGYWGLYALGSPLDGKEMLAGSEDAVMYKKIKWSNELDELDSPKLALSGYEIEKAQGKFKDDEELCWKLLREYYSYYAENMDDSEKLLEYIDEENYMHHYVFLNMIQGRDNGAGERRYKNDCLCLTERDGEIKSIISPWDMDLTLGNMWVNDAEGNNTAVYQLKAGKNYEFKHGYLRRIIDNEDTDIIERINECYRELRKDAWSDDHINSLIDEYEAEIYGSGAFVRDKERWPDGTYNEAEEGLSVFRRYVMDRLKACDEYYGM